MRDPARAGAHQDIMASPHFQEASKVALLEYQTRMNLSDGAAAAVGALKLKGASEFLHILMNLGEPESPKSQKRDEPLNSV